MIRHVLSSAWLLATLGLALPAAAHAEGPAHGLIVQLKNAAPHHGLHAGADAPRWKRLLQDTALDRGVDAPSAPRLVPNGRAAQLLRFSRALGAAEAEQLAQRLRQRPDVEWVAANVRERALQVSDPMFPSQWWLQPHSGSNAHPLPMRLRGVPSFMAAWTRGVTGSSAAPVGVLDTGITAHPELAGRTLPGHDFVDRDTDPSDPGDWVDAPSPTCEAADSSWHGTIIAGIVAALTDNGEGVAAINWSGRVLPVRVAGRCGALLSDILDGMRWAGGLPVAGMSGLNPNPVRIINLSFGGTGACTAYQPVIDELRAKGVVVVAAAGNEYAAEPTRPAKCPGTIGVAALNRDGFKSNYSNFGPQLTVATVGGDDASGRWTGLADSGLLTITNNGTRGPGNPGYGSVFGTSFAVPVVAGAVSLMLSANPALTADQIIAGLRASARPHVTSPTIGACSIDNPGRCICSAATCGAGILDAEQAVLYAFDPAAYVAPASQPEVIDNAEVSAAAALGPDRPSNSASAPAAGNGDGGGGGGAMAPAWLLALGFAALVARRRR